MCTAACAGVCENVANRECTRDCRAELGPTCENACDTPDGALFCDGQFMNAPDHEACFDFFGIEPPDTLPLEKESGCSCRAGGGSDANAPLMLAALAIALLGRARRPRSEL